MRKIDSLRGFIKHAAGSSNEKAAELLGISVSDMDEALKINDVLTGVYRTQGLVNKLYIAQEFQPTPPKKTRASKS